MDKIDNLKTNPRLFYLSNPRFAFVRGDCFDGLEDYASSPELVVKSSKIIYPIPSIQTSIFGVDKVKGVIIRLGRFYEHVGQAIYGGEIKKPHELNINGPGGGTLIVEPDLTDGSRKRYRDQKGVQKGQALKLKSHQIAGKYIIQMFEDSSAPSKRLRYNGKSPKVPHINFDIFTHSSKDLFKRLREYGGRLEWLVEELTYSTRSMISVPFSLVYKMYSNILEPGPSGEIFNKRHETEQKLETTFNPSGLNTLLAFPEDMVQRLGLNPDHFNFIKSRFPQGVTVNGYKITSFPVLQITEKNHWNQVQILYKGIRQRENLREIFFSAEDEIPFSIPYVTPGSDIRREGWSGDDEEGGEISPPPPDEFPF